MPAYCTHYIFACELLPALTELAGFDLNRDAVMLGTQGPDVFFFHRIAPWMPGRSQRKIGSRLHRAKPGDILDAMAEYCTRCSTERTLPALTPTALFFITPWTGSAIPLCTPSNRSWRTAAAPCTNPPCIIL